MLTGPVTTLQWSLVRVDQPRSDTCRQIALAIRDEVLDAEAAGIGIIQIDEASPLEGCRCVVETGTNTGTGPWTAFGVADDTQVHTPSCYAAFNDIMLSIAEMEVKPSPINPFETAANEG